MLAASGTALSNYPDYFAGYLYGIDFAPVMTDLLLMKQQNVVTQYMKDPSKSLHLALAGPKFVFGLMTGLVESNDLYEIDHCAYDTYDTVYLVCLMVDHLMKGDYYHAIREC